MEDLVSIRITPIDFRALVVISINFFAKSPDLASTYDWAMDESVPLLWRPEQGTFRSQALRFMTLGSLIHISEKAVDPATFAEFHQHRKATSFHAHNF